MRHGMFFSMIIGAALMIDGCDKENFVSPSPTSSGSAIAPAKAIGSGDPSGDSGGERHSLYIRASFTTISVVLAPPPFLRLQINGTGRGTHIGRATFVSYPTINFTVPPPFPLTGTQVITAANGDEIFTSFAGSSLPPDPNGNTYITNTQTITGGTGRFAGATGTLAGTAVAHAGSQIGTAALEGTIYVRHGDDDGDDDDTAVRVKEVN